MQPAAQEHTHENGPPPKGKEAARHWNVRTDASDRGYPVKQLNALAILAVQAAAHTFIIEDAAGASTL